MNERFRKTLVLALRSDTGENEAAAAFSALRRMASNGSVSELLNEKPTQVKEKVVYKDKVIYMPKSYTHSLTYTTVIKATYLQDYINTVFTAAVKNDMCVHLISLEGSSDNKITSPTMLKFKVLGYELQIKEFSKFLDKIEKEMKEKSGGAPDIKNNFSKKKPNLLVRIFNAIFD